MKLTQRLVFILAPGFGAALTVLAGGCSDDPAPNNANTNVVKQPDSGTPVQTEDASSTPDASSPPDATPDVVEPDASGPQVSANVGNTCFLTIADDTAIGECYEDNLIIETSDAPDCVAHIRSGSKRPSIAAGDFELSGTNFGQPGGPATATITISPDPGFGDLYFLDATGGPLFLRTASQTVNVEKSPTDTFPAIALTALKSPEPVVTQPLSAGASPFDGGVMPIPVKSGQPLEFAWSTPDGSGAGARLIANLYFIVGGTTHFADIRCGFPLGAGKGTMPSSLLQEVRQRLASMDVGPLSARITMAAGDQRHIRAGANSYVIELTHLDATAFPNDLDAELE